VTGDQLSGCILGQALGDALGFVVEAEPPEVARDYVQAWLRAGRGAERSARGFPFGQYSDDTQLARELLRSFLDARGWSPPAFAARIAELFKDNSDVGAGSGTRAAAIRLLAGVPWNASGTPAPYAGNGSAMRAGALGILLPNREAMIEAASQQSRITHLDPRCAAGAIVIARAVALAARREPLEPFAFLTDLAECAGGADASVAAAVDGLKSWLSYSPERAARHVHRAGLDPAHMHHWQGISGFVTPSVVWSLYAFLRSADDYWETMCTAIAVGGDTDTMAAMAGAISGARVGPGSLPKPLLARLTDRGEWSVAELGQLAQGCAALVAP
jgi:ADP-ribosylglycohydrolase